MCFVKRKSRKKSKGFPDFIIRNSRELASACFSCLTHQGMSHPVALALK
jgi:hypothetical protein